jgi:hypothetical protein
VWNNSTLIKGNIVEETTKLKRQLGKDIGILAAATSSGRWSVPTRRS